MLGSLDGVCKEDLYISEYIGRDKDGRTDWSTKSNKKIRNVRKQLMKLLPSYKDKILIFSISPLGLAWKETRRRQGRSD
jgi:hypothetical protein